MCGRGSLFAENKPARFDFNLKQQLELRQPTYEALRWIASRNDVLINRVEVSLDFVFGGDEERDDAFEFLHRHLVRRWHRRHREVKLVKGETRSMTADPHQTRP